MKFSITSDAYDINQSIDERLRHFSIAGFTHVHWCEHWTSDIFYSKSYAEEIAQKAGKYGIRIQNIHGVCRLHRNRPLTGSHWVDLNANRIQFISWLGGDCIVLHVPLDDCERGFESERDESERLIRLLIPEAKKQNVRLAIENIESRPCKRLFDHLFQTFPSEELGFCFDSGHANIMGEIDILERYLDRLIMTHLHDNHGYTDEHLLPGEGTLPWKPIVLNLNKKPNLAFVNLEAYWSRTIPKKDWCCQAYQSIQALWRQYGQAS